MATTKTATAKTVTKTAPKTISTPKKKILKKKTVTAAAARPATKPLAKTGASAQTKPAKKLIAKKEPVTAKKTTTTKEPTTVKKTTTTKEPTPVKKTTTTAVKAKAEVKTAKKPVALKKVEVSQKPVKAEAQPNEAEKKTSPAQGLATEAEVLAMGADDYMNDRMLAFFRHRLQQMEQELRSNATQTSENLRDTTVIPDPADRATVEEEHALELRTRDRERKLLMKVQAAIRRIDSGDYGWCEETGEPIGAARLIARPTATLSVEAQQRREIKQKMFGD